MLIQTVDTTWYLASMLLNSNGNKAYFQITTVLKIEHSFSVTNYK
jgi:hypothetical protein